MSRHSARPPFSQHLFLWLFLLLALALLPHASVAAPPPPGADAIDVAATSEHKIDPQVRADLAENGQAGFWLLLPPTENLAQAARIQNWTARGEAVYQRLRTHAANSQAPLLALLRVRGIDHRAFWLVNAVRVTGDAALLDELAARPEVVRVLPSRIYEIPRPTPSASPRVGDDIEWNIFNIRAPDAWATFATQGEGIVVANIDGGVDYTHPALAAQYRGNLGNGVFDHNYSWYDPMGDCTSPSTVPCDEDGHGTHTMGTMVGSDGPAGPNQIGVAPRSRWIAAKGCSYYGCPDEALLLAGEWILAPTDLAGNNPRPALRPHVVNNSWGGYGGDVFFQAIVQAWEAAGIFPVFAVGNDGAYGCQSAGSPGDQPDSYAVGAYDSENRIAYFSGRGPSAFDGIIKPNIAAPGVEVRSSIPGGAYAPWDGTSMAAPHVAGTVALMWSAAPALAGNVAETRNLLDQSARDMDDLSCGGTPADNNVWGEGKLDAYIAVERSPRGPAGILQGVVTPAGAEIEAVGPISRTLLTDSQGAYRAHLSVGVYRVTATLFGYLKQTAENVVVNEGATTVQDFQLVPAPRFRLSGHVHDKDGKPLAAASVRLLNTPLPPVQTDAAGFYLINDVPAGEYAVRAESGGCNGAQTHQLALDGERVLNFVLPEKEDTFGYRCRSIPPAYVEAGTSLPAPYYGEPVRISLPFAFYFYDKFYTEAHVCGSGVLTFDRYCSYNNKEIPGYNTLGPAIYPFWDDLYIYGSVIRTETLGSHPNRRFVIEWRDVALFSADSPPPHIDFEIILFEDGQIQFHYRNIDKNDVEMGGSATVGIEAGDGMTGLQYSYNQPLIASPDFALLFVPPPGTTVSGRVSNSSRGVGVSRATVEALSAGAQSYTTTTSLEGFYHLRLAAGLYSLQVSATDYLSRSGQLTISENDGYVVRDVALDSAHMEISTPSLQISLTQGSRQTALVTLVNRGGTDLHWKALESPPRRDPPSTAPVMLPGLGQGNNRADAQGAQQPNALPDSLSQPRQMEGHPAPGLVLEDPVGDSEGVDIVAVYGASDGVDALSLAVEVTGSVPLTSVIGLVLLDTDQNPDTGDPPMYWSGLTEHTLGIEYLVYLYPNGLVEVYDTSTFLMTALSYGRIEGRRYAFDIPLAGLGHDDGAVDLAVVMGDILGFADWAPNRGRGSVYAVQDYPWVTLYPVTGTLAPGAAQAVEIRLDGASSALDASTVHSLSLTFVGNDPVVRALRTPIRVQMVGDEPGPELSVESSGVTHFGGTVTVPLRFTGSQHGVTSLDFDLLLPGDCLELSPTDANSDGIPDAVTIALGQEYSRTATLIDDGGGKRLRVHVADLSAPFTPLPDGQVAAVAFTAACQPPHNGHIAVPLALSSPPALRFQNSAGTSIPGKGVDGEARILWGTPGDSNGDGAVNGADVAWTIDELFDGDGPFWLDAPGGRLVSNPVGADANRDDRIDAGDVPCAALLADGGPGACPPGVRGGDLLPTALLSITRQIPVSLGETVTVPLYFADQGSQAVAAAFHLIFDPAWLHLPPGDANGDGIPDAVSLSLSGGYSATVVYRAGSGQMALFVGDVTPPLTPLATSLSNGMLGTVSFRVQASGQGMQAASARGADGVLLTTLSSVYDRKRETLLHFSQSPAPSAGDSSGRSLPVTAQDGSLLITVHEFFVPLLSR